MVTQEDTDTQTPVLVDQELVIGLREQTLVVTNAAGEVVTTNAGGGTDDARSED